MGDIEIHCAAGDGKIERLQRLLTDRQRDINHQDGWKRTPLHNAASGGHTDCVKFLIQHGADTNIQDMWERTPLYKAASGGHTQCVELLLQHGADTSIQDRWKRTPLHKAVRSGHTECVQLLLRHRANTSIQDENWMTPLHLAARGCHTECIQLLLQHGADTSIQDVRGRTPLHWAAVVGHTQCVQLLLQHGADATIQNEKKKIPRMLAEEKQCLAVVELLRRFENHDVKVYIQTRTLEYLAEILDPQEYSIFNLTNLDPNFHDLFQFGKIQGVKDWLAKNNYTTIKDISDGLLAANLLQLSRAAVEYYAEVVKKISNMSPDEFEALCRTLTIAKYMYTPSSTTCGLKSTSVPLDQCHQDAFIAFAEEDEPTIEPIVRQLKKLDIQCWYSEEDLIPGRYEYKETVMAIRSSRISILFLSKSFIQNLGCNYVMENIIRNATEKKHGVIPVVMNITPEEIPDGLRSWKHFFFDDQELVSNILAAIKGPENTPTYGQIRHENKVLRDQNEVLRDDNEVLRHKNKALLEENEVLRDAVR
ncbi:serine/threonine-protein phosphatase 6 regulatory ankyrin repeat subunit B [Lingula anatina]|uniref:Serine/threonine-protein phosphatase 6 regulatory ankyrin repeat subunit B n=1 Tax=Lingula anatina TaxID=7574 RepID=A0A1S3GZ65_LINAN|nr:serine/threonine-protein phosphatase 6 regulatory ankyrin repeat subunit B [Lingula anatina]|eukprot:XP_013378966.1 serine/threonine-protein phosphatase 6 regulatory ankyrin repeat subunit B [Lingula anatina]